MVALISAITSEIHFFLIYYFGWNGEKFWRLPFGFLTMIGLATLAKDPK